MFQRSSRPLGESCPHRNFRATGSPSSELLFQFKALSLWVLCRDLLHGDERAQCPWEPGELPRSPCKKTSDCHTPAPLRPTDGHLLSVDWDYR